jgi:hypothetical protein
MQRRVQPICTGTRGLGRGACHASCSLVTASSRTNRAMQGSIYGFSNRPIPDRVLASEFCDSPSNSGINIFYFGCDDIGCSHDCIFRHGRNPRHPRRRATRVAIIGFRRCVVPAPGPASGICRTLQGTIRARTRHRVARGLIVDGENPST